MTCEKVANEVRWYIGERKVVLVVVVGLVVAVVVVVEEGEPWAPGQKGRGMTDHERPALSFPRIAHT